MNKKILIGSIIAIAILVLVSFTGVVGYQTTKSSTIAKASPLFAVRSSRAIDEESKDLSCDYVGKSKGSTISFPTCNSRNTQLQKVIDVISRMDDETFNRFIGLIINFMHQDNEIRNKNIGDGEIKNIINQLGTNPVELKHNIVGETDDITDTVLECTVCTMCTMGNCDYTSGVWFPGCLIIQLIIFLIQIIAFAYSMMVLPFTACFPCPI